MNYSKINKFKSFVNPVQINDLMQGEKIINSLWEENVWTFESQIIDKDINIFFNFETFNEILIAKVLLTLRLAGLSGPKPIRSGVEIFAYMLFSAIRAWKVILNRDVLIPRELGKDHLLNWLNSSSHLSIASQRTRTDLLSNWLQANPYLPQNLRLNIDSIPEDKISKIIKEDIKTKISGDSIRSPYSEHNMKVILAHSIKYINDFSYDVVNWHTALSYCWQNYASPYTKMKYTKNWLISLDSMDKSSPLYDQYMQARTANQIIGSVQLSVFQNELKMLEVACVIIIIFTAGMRHSEFINLSRNPVIRREETIKIVKLITKTAKTMGGETIEVPIPLITLKAIEILSKLGNNFTGQKNGPLWTNYLVHSRSDNGRVDQGKMLRSLGLFSQNIGIEEAPLPHHFRHAIAHMVVQKDPMHGLEILRKLFHHKNISMTIYYVLKSPYYKKLFQEAQNSISLNIFSEFVNSIENGVLYGKDSKNILNTMQSSQKIDQTRFYGKIMDAMDVPNETMILRQKQVESYKQLVEDGVIVLRDTGISLCSEIVDTTIDVDFDRPCLNKEFFADNYLHFGPIVDLKRCKPFECKYSLFTETHVQNIKELSEQLNHASQDIEILYGESSLLLGAYKKAKKPIQKFLENIEKQETEEKRVENG